MPIGLEYHYQAIKSFSGISPVKGGARKETPNTKRNKKIFGAGDEETGWRCGAGGGGVGGRSIVGSGVGVAAQLLGGRNEMYSKLTSDGERPFLFLHGDL